MGSGGHEATYPFEDGSKATVLESRPVAKRVLPG